MQAVMEKERVIHSGIISISFVMQHSNINLSFLIRFASCQLVALPLVPRSESQFRIQCSTTSRRVGILPVGNQFPRIAACQWRGAGIRSTCESVTSSLRNHQGASPIVIRPEQFDVGKMPLMNHSTWQNHGTSTEDVQSVVIQHESMASWLFGFPHSVCNDGFFPRTRHELTVSPGETVRTVVQGMRCAIAGTMQEWIPYVPGLWSVYVPLLPTFPISLE
ncbi:hypothetical protein P152DRAFT_98855 [Eremomyces bilateralis CBS 781.70]|uniref:Uncharacterized protein n=1 Tax=Eremomyces bilateralis CBS 781.70 TaxID=1392243 RepID=A0A6G1FXY1_9PEZI|nr:uncharacterized protein P152DRAFT_98855 [Eremomyces bilateralis CBS 781.70]KAF1810449.1 hypothetical protein P152DRAFT_98855 [Eremomyces bilateralis CBS 781.70]